MYDLQIEENAEKFLRKIQRKDVEIILKKLNSIRDNPFLHLKRLKGEKLWRLRIMKYRVLLDILISGKKITVLRIGYRKKVYD
ncbi:MAG: type II toxin-antitoxin system RelE/ParE family toxin [Nanoarchaeota archaeon]|nr:type II toxin-antitoxin system RelE/ParE family toxin [Nanoarchaeota archaeon]MBU1028115.1 type II toxin-antitoxin system RelE/ParE family toxin [Nanoarchaeota archaeon]